MREVDAYRLFAHVPTIISAVDHSVSTDRGGGSGDDASKTVYVLLPYYRRGNLQDMINANLVNHAAFPERRLMMLFLGVCKALRAMHEYKPAGAPVERMEMGREEDHPAAAAAGGSSGGGRRMNTRGKRTEEEEEDEQERPLMEGENQVAGGRTIQSYAHRDIKPGKTKKTFPNFVFPHGQTKANYSPSPKETS